MAQENTPQENLGTGLDLEDRVSVYPARGLPELNSAGGAAYEARLKNDVTQNLFAVVCSRDYLPRTEDINSIRNVDSPSAIRLRESGVLYWPEQNASYYTMVYEKPLAGRFWDSLDEKHPTMTEDALTQSFIRPLVKTFLDYKVTGAVHGAIRPTNIFWKAGSSTPPQFGGALSAPCGVGQSVIFETIERGMCSDVARGTAQHSDDCYAFGATVAMIILGKNPFQGMDDIAIVNVKLEKGSFNAFVGSRSLPSAQIELLRGLLMDDAVQRWTAEDIEQWISGRRLTARSSDAGRKSSRQFKFCGKDYWRVKPLAWGLSQNLGEAVRVIEDGSLGKWVARSLGDDEVYKDIAEAIERLRNSGQSAHYQEQLAARISMALDPTGPIRYRGLSVMPQGVGTYLAHVLRNGGDVQIIAEIITSQLVTFWVNLQHDAKVDLVPLAQTMERMNSVLEKTAYGEGIERVLYELNPTIPCLSPMLRAECVIRPRSVMASLERVAGTGMQPSEPMDRHLAGFLIARERRTSSLFAAMDPSESVMRRGLALLTLFGEMQYRHGPDKVPKLAAWIMPMVELCISRFLSKPFQDKVRKQATGAVASGNLASLLKIVDDPGRVTGDEQDFLRARLMYVKISREIKILEKQMKDKKLAIQDVGRPVAASFASILAIILIGFTLMRAAMNMMVG